MSGPILSAHGVISQAAAAGGTVALSLPLMAGAVLFGSVLPIVPTGPIVAAAAALPESHSVLSVALVIVIAAVAAFGGDIITFAVCRSQGSRALDWLVARHDSERVDWARDQMSRHAWRFLIVGRVLPAGRIAVLLAAGSLRYPWKGFLPAGAIAALIWSAVYAVVGLVGGALFESPLVAVGAAVILALLITAVPALYRRIRGRGAGSRAATPDAGSPDAGSPDAGSPDAGVTPDSATQPAGPPR